MQLGMDLEKAYLGSKISFEEYFVESDQKRCAILTCAMMLRKWKVIVS